MELLPLIKKPTLLLDVNRSRANLQRMSVKARNQNVRFRPHFKTHQSAEIGAWFREEGVHQITVSSIDMAYYFAQHGWKDITIAFPFNWRQVDEANALAEQVHLELLVESVDTVHYLGANLTQPVDIWIKIDVGAHRTGINWEDVKTVRSIIAEIMRYPKLHLRGSLTHAGHTYHANNRKDIIEIYQGSLHKLGSIRDQLRPDGFALEISVGDTPACSLMEHLGDVDEIRPGNFIFYDVQQWMLDCCSEEDIAVAVACPVVAKHPDRKEVVIYGGAIHLSKDYILENGHPCYGQIAFPEDNGWGSSIPGGYVSALSQEHGIVRFDAGGYERVCIGELLIVLPVHSCLVISALPNYLTLQGQTIEKMSANDCRELSA